MSAISSLNRSVRAIRHAIGGLLLAGIGCFLASTGPARADSTNDVLILELKGIVEITRAGAAAADPAYTNQVLRPGDRGRTLDRSHVVLRMSDLSILRIGERSSFTIRTLPAVKQTSFSLLRGLAYFLNRERPATTRFQSRTATAAIRGTEFVVEVDDNDRMTVTLFEGEVELSNAEGSVTLVSAEQGAVVQGVAEPGKRPEQTAVLDASAVIQWFLYYPAVLDLDDLGLSDDEQKALAESIAAYRQGDLTQALAKHPAGGEPASDAGKTYLAALLLALGHVPQTEALLNSVSATGPTAPVNALRRLIAAVKGRSEDLPAGTELVSASEWLAESYHLQSKARIPEALAAARRAVELSPGFGFAWARVAELEFSSGRSRQTKAALDRALELCPRHAQAHALNGFVLAGRNQVSEALAAFDQAIAIDGALANAWLGRGLCRIKSGRAAPGREDLQMAAALEPQRAALRSYLGKAFSQTRDFTRAEQEIEHGKKMDPKDPTGWLYSALLKHAENRVNEAIEDLEHSQEMNDNRAVYRSRLLLDQDRAVRGANLANLYQDAGMNDVAFREAGRAVNADYANYSAHLFLANSYNQLRDPNLVNLRYETPWLSEYLVANLLAPVGAGTLSQTVSQQEYSRLFERDRLGFVSSTEYLSRGDWSQSAAQFGTFANSSYALEAFYRSLNGQRPNNDLEQLGFTLQFKQQLTPADSVYLQAVDYKAEGGDLAQYYSPTNANLTLRTKETQEPLLMFGYHHEWSPEHRTLLLASRLQDTLRVKDSNQFSAVLGTLTNAVLDALPVALGEDYRSDLEVYSVEAQHIWQHRPINVILGARFQTGEFDSSSLQTNVRPAFIAPAFPPGGTRTNATSDFERITAYAYGMWQVFDPLQLIGGLTYDYLTYPLNHRFAPLTSAEETTDRLSPKAGFIYQPHRRTTVRGAYSQSLGGVSFDQSFQLEPSQIAGFNQAFRSIIPESAAGVMTAARFESATLELDHRLPSRTYLAVRGEYLTSKGDRAVGVFELPGFFPPVTPWTTTESLDYKERTFTALVNQLLSDTWSIGASYRLSQAELHSQYLSVPPSPPSGFVPRQDRESTLHQVDLFAVYNLASGFFARFDAVWYQQDNEGTFAQPGDNFWQFNAYAGWRFYKRRAELRLGLLNLTDQDYNLDPLNLTTELPRDLTFAVNFRFAF